MNEELKTFGTSIWDVQLQRANAEIEYNKLVAELHSSELYEKVQEAQKRLKEYEEAENTLKQNILNGMRENNLKSLEFTNQKFTVKQNPPSVSIMDEGMIDDKYKKEKTTITIDKTAIKNDLKEGKEVFGAELSYSYSLVISPK